MIAAHIGQRFAQKDQYQDQLFLKLFQFRLKFALFDFYLKKMLLIDLTVISASKLIQTFLVIKVIFCSLKIDWSNVFRFEIFYTPKIQVRRMHSPYWADKMQKMVSFIGNQLIGLALDEDSLFQSKAIILGLFLLNKLQPKLDYFHSNLARLGKLANLNKQKI